MRNLFVISVLLWLLQSSIAMGFQFPTMENLPTVAEKGHRLQITSQTMFYGINADTGRPDEDLICRAEVGVKVDVLEIHSGIVFVRVKSVVDDLSDLPGNAVPSVKRGLTYAIEEHRLTRINAELSSAYFLGGVTLPLKYNFPNSSGAEGLFTTEANLSGAFGYSRQVGRFKLTPMVFAGAAGIPVSDINATDVEIKLGFTYGAVIAASIASSNLQVGVFAGQDMVKGENWDYDGKWWVSIGIGFLFSKNL
jgi:hypothetical protein